MLARNSLTSCSVSFKANKQEVVIRDDLKERFGTCSLCWLRSNFSFAAFAAYAKLGSAIVQYHVLPYIVLFAQLDCRSIDTGFEFCLPIKEQFPAAFKLFWDQPVVGCSPAKFFQFLLRQFASFLLLC